MKRPDGVTLIAVLHFVEAGLALLGLLLVCVFVLIIPMIAITPERDPNAGVAIWTLVIITLVVGVVLIPLSAANIAVGWGMMQLRPWARMGAVVLSVLRLLNIPIGTVIGGLSLWYLFQPEALAAFGEEVEASE